MRLVGIVRALGERVIGNVGFSRPGQKRRSSHRVETQPFHILVRGYPGNLPTKSEEFRCVQSDFHIGRRQ